MHRPLSALLILLVASVSAQETSRPNKTLKTTTIQFKWSNDFVYDTDYYFTNGFHFEVLGPWAKKNLLNSILIPSSKNSLDRYGITLVQDMFTPKEKFDVEKQLDGDRPFAAYLMIGVLKKSIYRPKKLSIISEIQFGVLGPAAQGKETQDAIHNMTGNSANLIGWENQISNSLAINYSVSISKTLYSSGWLDFYATGKGGLGIPHTFIQISGGLRIGVFDEYPHGFEMLSNRKTTTFVFVELYERLVGYNATLQGGVFSTSTYTIDKINHLVGGYKLGISFVYSLFKLELATTYNNPEFDGALSHKWAYVIVKAGF